jgi:SAM-dependent methyltransferase
VGPGRPGAHAGDHLTGWKAKAALQTVFSHVPGGEALNYLCQRRIFRNLPVSDETFRATAANARRHLEKLRYHGSVPVGEARFYEFGAGKDLIIPLTYYCLGVAGQVIADIRDLARDELVVDAVRRLSGGLVPDLLRAPDAALGFPGRKQRLAALGITYRAPCDARATGFDDASVDYITSTSTLEHIPADDIRLILRESRRILRPDGRMSMLIDYQDHYSYADSSISAYNFLRFEEREWARWNPSLQYQNRLRHSDYLEMFESDGFEVIDEEIVAGSPADLETIAQLPPAPEFSDRDAADVAIRLAMVTLRPAGTLA